MSTRLDARLLTTARALTRWQPDDLARFAGVPQEVIEAIELNTGSAPHSAGDNDALVAAFEAAGLEFGEMNGTTGVRFRTQRSGDAPASLPPEGLNASNDE